MQGDRKAGDAAVLPSFSQEDARIFTWYVEMGAKGSSSQMSPLALPCFLRMRLPQIRAGSAARCGPVLSQCSSLFAMHGFSMQLPPFLQRHVDVVGPKGDERWRQWRAGEWAYMEDVGLGCQRLGCIQQARPELLFVPKEMLSQVAKEQKGWSRTSGTYLSPPARECAMA